MPMTPDIKIDTAPIVEEARRSLAAGLRAIADDVDPARPPSPLMEDEDGAPYPEGVQAIAQERGRQLTELGYTAEHDDTHHVYDFVGVAIHLLGGTPPYPTAFVCQRADPDAVTYQRDDLVRAGALIAAAIDRLGNE